ncbi:MAG: anaerobic ribonucleoside-triphosphate reductase activating protein [Candidatus Carbobacillus altaicus]|nr:anaerobic ribonucleoside-triphosphate reductase activating protein [Candidatus Carbobacillus altaicus]
MIYDLLPLSLIDDPGHLAATIFTSGCRLRCPFCHNAALQKKQPPRTSVAAILRFLRERQGVLESVAITGGEPLLWPDMESFMRSVRALGYRIKLDTSGDVPDRLERLLRLGLIDYVAMDVKDEKARYGLYAPDSKTAERVHRSMALLASLAPAYELRTTVVPNLHLQDEQIVRAVFWAYRATGASIDRWALQAYRPSPGVMDVDRSGHAATPPLRLRELARAVEETGLVKEVVLRV